VRYELTKSSRVTVSGDIVLGLGDAGIGGVEIKDQNTDIRANVTQAGLQVEVNNTCVIGEGVQVAIDGTERRLDMTPLTIPFGYPMTVEIESRNAPSLLTQGDSTITLTGVPYRLTTDNWRIVTVSGVEEAYIAVKRESTTTSGTLVGTRIDMI
jgi:hypothetical protein